MTDEEACKLGQRVLAAGWDWTIAWGALPIGEYYRYDPSWGWESLDQTKVRPPDLRDPATKGILLYHVRNLLGPYVCTGYTFFSPEDGWLWSCWRNSDGWGQYLGKNTRRKTEEESLVSALEIGHARKVGQATGDAR